ncbi:zinc-binding protein A33-like [Eleginops maclovinus]|uniref:zinc-binding protein A33-like n=1 Tax=Eleginops maclovinus TaxID=56733 RepID=UPI00307FF9F4
MASAANSEDNLRCSVCLNIFKKPVTIPCGHNFCLNCIDNYWDTIDTTFQCPLCMEKFLNRPMLRVNTILAQMAADFKESFEEKYFETPDKAVNGTVLCGLCTGAKLAAVKSCLVCFMSYCETHLEPHLRIQAMKKHKLIDPVENPESRMCKTHDEPLELFCKVEEMFVCESCKNSDHKKHKIVSLKEEANCRKYTLEKDKENADQMIQERKQKILEIERSVEASRKKAAKALSSSKHSITGMVDYINRSYAELTEVVDIKQKKFETERKGFIKELEADIMQIKQQKLKLDQVSISNDPMIFLENLLSLTIPHPSVKDWFGVNFDSDEILLQEATAQLEATVMREIRMLCDPDLKEMQRHAVDVTLDPDTANLFLHVSPDGKQVTYGEKKRNLPDKPERFEQVLNVLAKEGFSSGKFYYEVEVKDKTNWDLGVVNQSINRKGDIRLSPKNGYWIIGLKKGKELTANVSPVVSLKVRETPQKIGVFVDYEVGQVLFYDVDTRACIFSYTGCNFTMKLFPFFSHCCNDDYRNAAPLIITPVKQNR